jgi:hypothetical protein
MTQFLRRPVCLSTAIGGLHKMELIHNDVKPANDGSVQPQRFRMASRQTDC